MSATGVEHVAHSRELTGLRVIYFRIEAINALSVTSTRKQDRPIVEQGGRMAVTDRCHAPDRGKATTTGIVEFGRS